MESLAAGAAVPCGAVLSLPHCRAWDLLGVGALELVPMGICQQGWHCRMWVLGKQS